MHQDSVTSIMSTQVMSVLPHTPVLTVIDILLTNNFNGIPVVDKNNIIVGIITKYDLIVRRGSIFDDMEAKDVMNNDPLVLKDDLNIEDAVKAFSEHHRVDPIPIVDNNNKVIGIISRADMVKLFRGYIGNVPKLNRDTEVKGISLLNKKVEEKKDKFGWWVAGALIAGGALLGYIIFYVIA